MTSEKKSTLHELIDYYDSMGEEHVPLQLFRVLLNRVDKIALGLEKVEDVIILGDDSPLAEPTSEDRS